MPLLSMYQIPAILLGSSRTSDEASCLNLCGFAHILAVSASVGIASESSSRKESSGPCAAS